MNDEAFSPAQRVNEYPTTLPRDGPIVVRYKTNRIRVVGGPDTGLSRNLVTHALRIGTSPDNDLVLTDTTVSRRHCTIEPSKDGLRIRDEHSTNGVTIERMRVYDALVTPPAKIHLGHTTLEVTPLTKTVLREQAMTQSFGRLLGSSATMRELFADLARIASTDVTLLVEGETGTGKELVAESVHQASHRARGPFVVFDCSATASTLIESELFGHERGAFTGAVTSRAGVFEQAHGGTIFLDELGELPKDLQPKLLRVIEKREVRRLGSKTTLPVDVRLVAATNRNLSAEVARRRFREDLYFRIAAAQVHVPPLRERMEDLEMLVDHFLTHATAPRSAGEIPLHIWDMFRAHRWPGNVRELKNAVERLLVTPDRAIPLQRLVPAGSEAQFAADADRKIPPLSVARRDATDDFERSYLGAILQRTNGNVTRAAAIAEVSRQMIQKLMRKHGVD